MKRLITAALAAALLLTCMAGCGSKKETTDYDTTSRVLYSDDDTETETETEEEEETDSEEESSKEEKKEADSEKKTSSKAASSKKATTSKAASSKAASSKTAVTSSKKAATTTSSKAASSKPADTSSAASSSTTSSENTSSAGSTDTSTDTANDSDVRFDTETDSETTSAGSFDESADLVFSYGSYTVMLNADINDVLPNMPSDYEESSAPSCLYPGLLDKSYDFGDYTINTFPTKDGEGEYVSGIKLTGSSVSTEKDVRVSSPLSAVLETYGEDYILIGGSTYRYVSSDGKSFLQFYCEDDVVSEILISLDSSMIG